MNYLEQVDLVEENCFYKVSGIADKELKKIEGSSIDLNSKENFSSDLKSFFDRENIIIYGKLVSETPVKMATTSGEFNLPLVDISELNKVFEKIDKKKRSKISYIHLSTIQIIVKSTYLKGINSPISLALTDERILDEVDKLIGIVHGNLSNVTVKFNSMLGYAIPFREESLNRSVHLAYKLHRKNLMRENDEPFSITYAVNYALTNSHHSIQFKREDRIYLDKLFEKISVCEIPKQKPTTELKSLTYSKSIQEKGFEPVKSFENIKRSILPPPMLKQEKDIPESSNQKEIEKLTTTVNNLSAYLKTRI